VLGASLRLLGRTVSEIDGGNDGWSVEGIREGIALGASLRLLEKSVCEKDGGNDGAVEDTSEGIVLGALLSRLIRNEKIFGCRTVILFKKLFFLSRSISTIIIFIASLFRLLVTKDRTEIEIWSEDVNTKKIPADSSKCVLSNLMISK